MKHYSPRLALGRWLALLALGAALAVSAADTLPPDTNPEAQTAYIQKQAVTARHYMAATANPLATQAAYRILQRGGSAVDAAIAAQMMLTLTEPQSSGIGGGAFILYYGADDGTVQVFDGRETAPAHATAYRFMDGARAIGFSKAVNSGKSVGVPGVLRALELAHLRHGKLPWQELFDDAIEQARRGFPISQRLARLLEGSGRLAAQAAAKAYFYHPDGSPKREGELLRNPALARSLQAIAHQGADAFYQGKIAQAMVRAVSEHESPGDLSLNDLARYAAIERPALCGPYRSYTVCGAPPPSSGGLAILQMLALLQTTDIGQSAPNSLAAVHLFSEAGRLAYADRDRYVADPDFVPVPTDALLSHAYLARRARLISPTRSMGKAHAGEPFPGALALRGLDDSPELPSTSHISIVDAAGNAVSMTTSIEQAFGSKIFVEGFLLNNQLTDFSLSPVDEHGRPVANRVEGGKRPRSTMAPTIVLAPASPHPKLRLVVGSPGGSAIVNYVAKALIANLDWGLDIQSAIDLPNFGSRNEATEIERGSVLEALAPRLQAMGHPISVQSFPSGLHGIEVLGNGMLRAGADPRREGTALGN